MVEELMVQDEGEWVDRPLPAFEEIRGRMLEAQEKGKGVWNLEDEEGNLLPTRKPGTYSIMSIPLEKLRLLGGEDESLRKETAQTQRILSLLKVVGQVGVIHVAPLGSSVGLDEKGREIHKLYAILDGGTTYKALQAQGVKEAQCLVDTTIPTTLYKLYAIMMNMHEAYSFRERIEHLKTIQEMFPELDQGMMEQMLGYKQLGESFKALYVDSAKIEFPQIYQRVAEGKMSVDEGMKKIDRELAKREKEEEMDGQDVEDALREKSVDELEEMRNEVRQQEVGKREVLDAHLRKELEARAQGRCQCCGGAEGVQKPVGMSEEEFREIIASFVVIMEKHHIVDVQYKGSDSKDNIMLICPNCHDMIGEYEKGWRITDEMLRLKPYLKKIIFLGNIGLEAKRASLEILKTEAVEVFRKVDKGLLSVGKGLVQAKLDPKAELQYKDKGGPYGVYMDFCKKLEVLGDVNDESVKQAWDV